jgi:predicted TIM-barrel fold metal-dependent hydrolase
MLHRAGSSGSASRRFVISHVAPAAQERAGAEGRAHPDRFAGFAILPTADPQAAAELERAATQVGLVGALVNSTLGSNGAFLYFTRNIWVTISQLFSLPPVMCTVRVGRVLFSVDYPFGSRAAGRALLDALPLGPDEVAKIAGGNAERLLGLKPTAA